MAWLLALLSLLMPSMSPQVVIGSAPGGGSASLTAIGNNSGSFATTIVATTSSSAPIGGRIIASITIESANVDCTNGTNGVSGVTDSAGNTYVLDVNNVVSMVDRQCFYSAYVGTQLNSGGTVTDTCAMSGSCTHDLHVYYDSLSLSSGALDGTGGQFGTVVSATPITVTNSGSISTSDICLASAWANTGSSNPFGSNTWTSSFTTINNNTQLASGSIYISWGWVQIATGTPTTGIAWISGSGNGAGGILACYKE